MQRWPLKKGCAAVCSAMGAAALLTVCVSARASVAEFELDVSKTAVTSFTRTYSWEITKTADPEALTLGVGVPGEVTYAVELVRSIVDSDWAVSGEISIYNPNNFVVQVDSIDDYVYGSQPADVDCGGTSEIQAGATLTCTYMANLASGEDGTNYVSVFGTAIDVSGNPIDISGNVYGSGLEGFSFAEPTTVLGSECVDVSDSEEGPLGNFCDSETIPYYSTFQYAQPGVHTVPNTATIVDTGQSADAEVRITVVPEPGTLALLGLGLAGLAATRRRRK